jgi:iron-sulfur cluster repair protein YtfE (RIC family)
MRNEIDRIVELAEKPEPIKNIDEIEERFEFLWNFIEEHNEGEEAFVFPALNELSCDISEPFVWDHNEERETFEETLDLVRRVRSTKDATDMKALRSNLIGLRTSLHNHSRKEDQIIVPMIFEGIPPAMQGEILDKILSPKPPEQMMRELAWFMPPLTTDERADFFSVIKEGPKGKMPPEAFEMALDVVSKVIPPAEMDELRERVVVEPARRFSA